MHFTGHQSVQGPKDSFSAKMNKSFSESFRLLNELNDTKKDLFILINKFELESHERVSQNRPRRPFELIKLQLCYLFFLMSDRFA